jgi:hypothetical protein
VSPLDRAVLAERGLAVRRHLERVREKLPVSPDDLSADTDASDAVILHLWQATQIAIDLAVSASVALGGGPPRHAPRAPCCDDRPSRPACVPGGAQRARDQLAAQGARRRQKGRRPTF